MRCPSCSKFATNDTSNDPEVELEVNEDGAINGTARIVITSECCGDELKESNFEIHIEGEGPATLESHLKEKKCELSVECDASWIDRNETTSTETTSTRTLKSGKVVTKNIPYRYQKHFYGVEINYTVTCSCTDEKERVSWTGTWSDEVPAGGMDELI